MNELLDRIEANLKPGATAYYGVRCCWWTTNPSDLGVVPGEHPLPCCPYCGSVLMMGEASAFIAQARSNPCHYGPRQLDAFALAHHGSGQHHVYWDRYMPGAIPTQEVSEALQAPPPSTDRSMRCVVCATEFSEAETEGVDSCPACGAGGVPMAISGDVTVKVNWHELRVLGIWASNWAKSTCDPLLDSGKRAYEAETVVSAILRRLQAQHPDRPPLTLLGELEQLQEEYPEMEAFGPDGEVLISPKKPS